MQIKRTILIFDCYEFEREKTKMVFRGIDKFEFIEISKIEQFQAMTNNIKDISLIILDVEFPTSKEGFLLLAMIKENKYVKETPIVILTKADMGDYKARSRSYMVVDYILKPYSPARLEKTARFILNASKPAEYYFNKASVVTSSVEDFIMKEIKVSNRAKNSMSIVLITPNLVKIEKTGKDVVMKLMHEKIYDLTIMAIKNSSRVTDTIIFNDNRDIIIVLPCTDKEGVLLFNEKIVVNISKSLYAIELTFDDIFCSAYVTYPNEGSELRDLMSLALKKVSDKMHLYKIKSLDKSTIKAINSSYGKFTKWEN